MREAFIYVIECTATDKLYVGSSWDFHKRWKDHKRSLNTGKHGNRHLQSAWDLYGKDSFNFIVLESCTEVDRVEREQYWIDRLKVADKGIGLNLARLVSSGRPSGGNLEGKPHSIETKLRLSQQKSEKHLPRDVVIGMFSMCFEGARQTAVAKYYGVSQSLVNKIVNRQSLYANNIIDRHRATSYY